MTNSSIEIFECRVTSLTIFLVICATKCKVFDGVCIQTFVQYKGLKPWLMKHIFRNPPLRSFTVDNLKTAFGALDNPFNPLTPNDIYIYIYIYICRNAPLTSRRYILYI
jgi:hypothetical protein